MPRPKKPKPPKISKKLLLERLVEKPKVGIREWSIREFSILKKLAEKFPLEFLNEVNFGKKFASLAVLYSEWGLEELKRRYHAWSYTPKTPEKITLHDQKFGENWNGKKKQTLRDFI